MTTGDKAELLPCPFCGTEPLLDHATLIRDTYHWVRCANEKCNVLPSGMQCLKEADAIAAWNTRTLAAGVSGVPDDVRKGLAEFAKELSECAEAGHSYQMYSKDCAEIACWLKSLGVKGD